MGRGLPARRPQHHHRLTDRHRRTPGGPWAHPAFACAGSSIHAPSGAAKRFTFRAAQAELQGLFALFQDDDVLKLFEMKEPADAAVSRHDPIDVQLGVVDQRMEAWFRPFGAVAPTGYLHEPR